VSLSLTISAGRPRRAIRASSSRTTRRPPIELSTNQGEPPAPGQHVGDEVEQPALVGRLGARDRCARAGGPLADASPPHGQPFSRDSR
jgi:hypothetical protein